MATVFLAHDIKHQRQVAVKVLQDDVRRNASSPNAALVSMRNTMTFTGGCAAPRQNVHLNNGMVGAKPSPGRVFRSGMRPSG